MRHGRARCAFDDIHCLLGVEDSEEIWNGFGDVDGQGGLLYGWKNVDDHDEIWEDLEYVDGWNILLKDSEYVDAYEELGNGS